MYRKRKMLNISAHGMSRKFRKMYRIMTQMKLRKYSEFHYLFENSDYRKKSLWYVLPLGMENPMLIRMNWLPL
ncbi:MAG: hypothetical protein EBZ87_00670 [Microbacteriaceae bacterium]|nr:hypothetical protein [Microbacteriaceae bacterium]